MRDKYGMAALSREGASTMWHLNQQWEANRQKLAKLEQQQAEGMNISDERMNEARLQVARDNEHAQAIQRAEADRQAAATADLERQQAAQQARIDRAAESFRRTARLSFPGTDAEFEAQWPTIKADWQRRQTSAHLDAVTANAPRVRF